MKDGKSIQTKPLDEFDMELTSGRADGTTVFREGAVRILGYLAIGAMLGIIFVKSEVLSWFRIQEMFRFQSFHMYGLIGSAVAVGALSVWLIRRTGLKTSQGDPVQVETRPFHRGQILGGLIFGAGWAMTGACPGPIYAQIAAGFPVVVVVLLSAIAGTWVYGYFSGRLPH